MASQASALAASCTATSFSAPLEEQQQRRLSCFSSEFSGAAARPSSSPWPGSMFLPIVLQTKSQALRKFARCGHSLRAAASSSRHFAAAVDSSTTVSSGRVEEGPLSSAGECAQKQHAGTKKSSGTHYLNGRAGEDIIKLCTSLGQPKHIVKEIHQMLYEFKANHIDGSHRFSKAASEANSSHTIEGRNPDIKPAEEVFRVDGSLLRVGLMIAYPSLGLWMIDSNAGASELEQVSSSTLSAADMLPQSVAFLGDLDAGTAQLVTSLAGPFITVFNVLFIFRIIMSWYPGIPVEKFPFFLAYVPTEPVLGPTRRLIPPVGGVDVAPVIWVALMSFANEILLGKQGLLVLLSQQQS